MGQAMRIVFLGVGDAFDDSVPNTSIWIEADGDAGPCGILLDCGATVPPSYWSWIRDPERVDLIWISHFHADHFFGLPLLLYSLHRDRRRKSLSIFGPDGIQEIVPEVVELAFPGLRRRLCFPLILATMETDRPLQLRGMTWSFIDSSHRQKNLAVRIDNRNRSIYYSGDGEPTEHAVAMARGCDLIIHEAFRLDAGLPTYGHATIVQAIDFARHARVAELALVHLEWTLRRTHRADINRLIQAAPNIRIWLPEPGESRLL
jgi:ribonuclease Z